MARGNVVIEGDAVDVTSAKNAVQKDSAEPKGKPENSNKVAQSGAPVNAAQTQPAVPIRRKAPGAKEVPAFEWKLVGEANKLALTLFKAVEREDVEAQRARVDREGYYKNLRIMGIDEKIIQPSRASFRRTRQSYLSETAQNKPSKAGREDAKSPKAQEKPTKVKREPPKPPKAKAGVKSKTKARTKPKTKPKAKSKASSSSKSVGKAKASKTTRAKVTAKTKKKSTAKKKTSPKRTAKKKAK